ncbi:unnamed protein product [Ilex paraguariensis]|uniref:Uncharacterized protein n=1 Tax=Ilex paraguariensis TaxID=185542 RepID=A0ABC8TBD9_9AQUA
MDKWEKLLQAEEMSPTNIPYKKMDPNQGFVDSDKKTQSIGFIPLYPFCQTHPLFFHIVSRFSGLSALADSLISGDHISVFSDITLAITSHAYQISFPSPSNPSISLSSLCAPSSPANPLLRLGPIITPTNREKERHGHWKEKDRNKEKGERIRQIGDFLEEMPRSLLNESIIAALAFVAGGAFQCHKRGVRIGSLQHNKTEECWSATGL